MDSDKTRQMASPKLIISGMTEAERARYDLLCTRVTELVSPLARGGIDGSTLARFAIKVMIDRYGDRPGDLARQIGFVASEGQ